MRALCLSLLLSSLTACHVTRTVAGPVSSQFRTAGQTEGFAVKTTSMWRQRMDPGASVRFRAADGKWGDWLSALDLHVDNQGAWVKHSASAGDLADEIRITGISDEHAATIEKTRPEDAKVTRDGDAWVLTGPRAAMGIWARDLELAIAHLVRDKEPGGPCETPGTCTQHVRDDEALFFLRVSRRAEALGTWQLRSQGVGDGAPVSGHQIDRALNERRDTLVGYDWGAVESMQIRNLSGGRTLAALLGTSVIALVVLPVALVARGASMTSTGSTSSNVTSLVAGGDGGVGHIGAARDHGEWAPRVAPATSRYARPMFTTGTRVRSIIRLTASADATAATNADFFASGVIARVRLMEVFEIGGGVRQSWTHIDSTTKRSTSAVFQVGLNIPLDASGHSSFTLGVENGSGGAIARDVRIPWGPRFQPTSGRWFVSLQPATPSYLRMNNVAGGRWSLNIGGEVGLSF